jgi:GT2 family glycosyltransferase
MPKHQPVVTIPNLNGGQDIIDAIASLRAQTLQPYIIVVDNASTDDSVANIETKFPDIEIIRHDTNKGYAGGVNPGFKRAMQLGADYAAPFNDDAVADKNWLIKLVAFLDAHNSYAAVCPKVYKSGGQKVLDSTGDYLTVWGLPYPRGREETDTGQYDAQTDIFSPSGSASLYRISALQEVGLMDEDFFAYYEDVDLGFRLQLAGYKVGFEPNAIVHHQVGMTSGRMKGFTTYQTMKNVPLLLFKNVPMRHMPTIVPRFTLAYMLFFGRALQRGHGWYALKGMVVGAYLELKKLPQRWHTQKTATVSDSYIWSMYLHDLPPNAHALRKLRAKWRQFKEGKL